VRELYKRKDPKTGQLSEVWWCVYYDPAIGRTRRRSTHCRDKDAAREQRRRFERGAQADSSEDTPPPAPLVSAVLKNFITSGCLDVAPATRSFYRQKGRHVNRVLGALPVTDLATVQPVKSYIEQRLAEGAAQSSIYKELVALRQALHGAKEDGLIDFDPRMAFPRFRAKSKPKDRWLTPLEFLLLLRAFKRWEEGDDPAMHRQGAPHRQLWIVLAVYTGGNDSEVDGIRWEGIDWKGRRVHLPGAKRELRDRWVPLLPPLAAVLERSRQATGYVVGEWGNVRRDLHAACARAGIPPCSPNDLRRTFATWMANLGVPENVLVALMGHTSSKMIRRVYALLQPTLLAAEMAKLTGACTPGVPEIRPAETDMTVVSRESIAKVAEILTNPVLGPGIEPGTRGFSIRAPFNKYEKLSSKKRPRTSGVRVA
jgi:integrase/recombinase XerC